MGIQKFQDRIAEKCLSHLTMPEVQVWPTLAKREDHRRSQSVQSLIDETLLTPYSVRESSKLDINRYTDIRAYDRTAVPGVNANVVADSHGRWWVAAQAPLPSNFYTFFHNILHSTASAHPLINKPPSHSAVIVQLTGWEENGMRKADPYLPDPHGRLTFTHNRDSIILHHVNTTWLPSAGTSLSELKLEDMVLYHYHFKGWSDHGVPKNTSELRQLVMDVHAKQQEANCEVWVHCSAGVGRTGTFIALSSLLTSRREVGPQRSADKLPPAIASDPVARTVDELREWRTMLVQTPGQLGLIYKMM
ncbi:protein-tyrosine phosphatase-like protein [Kockovaella imperatae]|uniref:Protein-tyrosine phosphatase-like protein n=1 Tax=Kockovaella imperatae TaxID=4999 RepID=A0A1Y1USC7_9TREE|nr:protein-tyrosine phosphatase-like protein [Kockovaella imperatae]ORX40921.1 protein-tyrosine phosphatase-like protein [Kockovaella imperatae]